MLDITCTIIGTMLPLVKQVNTNLHRQMLAKNTSTLSQGTLLFFDRLSQSISLLRKCLDTTKDNTV